MKKFLFPISIITALFILVACVADKNINQPTESESIFNTESTSIEESTTQESIANEKETEMQEAVTENPSKEVISTTKEHTTNETTSAVVHTTQKNTNETTTASAEASTKETEKTETTTAAQVDIITKEDAKKIVLQHAGIAEADISYFNIELDREITGPKYDIDLCAGDYEYEYELNALNGNIIKSEKEAEKAITPPSAETTTVPVSETTTQTETTAPHPASLISAQQAKEIALNHAGVKETEIQRYTIELDKEIRKTVYEIGFYAGNFEYEYEINAENGDILKSEKEAKKAARIPVTTETTTKAATSDNLISKDQAKQIVLNHAGLSESDISRYEIETDKEKNGVTYEISFHFGNFEYEYEINAANGKILQSEKEHIDD